MKSDSKDVFEVTIADFGLAEQIEEGAKLTRKCGTPSYIAPEVLQGLGYSFKADIFGLGSMMYNLASGLFLFSGNDVDEILRNNRECNTEHIQKSINHLSASGQALLKLLVMKDPEMRPTAKEALQHPWFTEDKEALEQALIINNFLCG